MNKILAIILFPFIWLFFYVYRIVWFDVISTIIDIFCNLLISPLSSIWLLITFPLVIIFEIPIGLIATLISAIATSKQIFCNELDIAAAIKNGSYHR